MRVLLAIYLFLTILFNFNIQAQNPNFLPIIHVIGDSHCREFCLIPSCQIHYIESITMHRIGRDGLSFLNLPAFGVQEGQAVVFTFGEIDVRCHIGRQRDLFNRNLDEVLETLAAKYINTILQNRLLYQHLTCIVYSITPPTYHGGTNPELPFYGSIEDRVNITKKLNSKLAELCSQKGIVFLDVYNDYADANGILNPNLSDGSVHINPYFNQAIQTKLYQIFK